MDRGGRGQQHHDQFPGFGRCGRRGQSARAERQLRRDCWRLQQSDWPVGDRGIHRRRTEQHHREGAANSVIGGGAGNEVGQDAWEAFIGSGEHNRIQADARFGVIPGGQSNLVAGRYAFAAGNRAQALHEGSFVWADATDADFSSTAANQVSVRATGGVRLETGGAGLQIDGRGVGETVTSWQVAPSGTVQAEAGRAYLLLYNDQVLILPANPAIGEVVRVAGRGLTWRVRQQEGQRIMWSPGLQPNQEWIAVGQSRPWTGVAMSADGAQMLAGAWAGDLYISGTRVRRGRAPLRGRRTGMASPRRAMGPIWPPATTAARFTFPSIQVRPGTMWR